jgi:hypothetical protein
MINLTTVSNQNTPDDRYLDDLLKNPIRILSDKFVRPRFAALVEIMRKENRDVILYHQRDYMSLWQNGKRRGISFWARKVDHSTWIFRIRKGKAKKSPLLNIPRRYKIGTTKLSDGSVVLTERMAAKWAGRRMSKKAQAQYAEEILAGKKDPKEGRFHPDFREREFNRRKRKPQTPAEQKPES